MPEKQYMCSERAMQRLLTRKGIQIPIQALHRCESLEKMLNCLPSTIDCNISHPTLLELEKVVSPQNPAAIRILPPHQIELHTVLLLKLDHFHKIGYIQEEDGTIFKISYEDLQLLREKANNITLMCK